MSIRYLKHKNEFANLAVFLNTMAFKKGTMDPK